MLLDNFRVESPNVKYTEDAIVSTYDYDSTELVPGPNGAWSIVPKVEKYEFKTNTKLPKLG